MCRPASSLAEGETPQLQPSEDTAAPPNLRRRTTRRVLQGGVFKKSTTPERRHRPIRGSGYSPGARGRPREHRNDTFNKGTTSGDAAAVAQRAGFPLGKNSASNPGDGPPQDGTHPTATTISSRPPRRPHGRWSPASTWVPGSPARQEDPHHPRPPPRRTRTTADHQQLRRRSFRRPTAGPWRCRCHLDTPQQHTAQNPTTQIGPVGPDLSPQRTHCPSQSALEEGRSATTRKSTAAARRPPRRLPHGRGRPLPARATPPGRERPSPSSRFHRAPPPHPTPPVHQHLAAPASPPEPPRRHAPRESVAPPRPRSPVSPPPRERRRAPALPAPPGLSPATPSGGGEGRGGRRRG